MGGPRDYKVLCQNTGDSVDIIIEDLLEKKMCLRQIARHVAGKYGRFGQTWCP